MQKPVAVVTIFIALMASLLASCITFTPPKFRKNAPPAPREANLKPAPVPTPVPAAKPASTAPAASTVPAASTGMGLFFQPCFIPKFDRIDVLRQYHPGNSKTGTRAHVFDYTLAVARIGEGLYLDSNMNLFFWAGDLFVAPDGSNDFSTFDGKYTRKGDRIDFEAKNLLGETSHEVYTTTQVLNQTKNEVYGEVTEKGFQSWQNNVLAGKVYEGLVTPARDGKDAFIHDTGIWKDQVRIEGNVMKIQPDVLSPDQAMTFTLSENKLRIDVPLKVLLVPSIIKTGKLLVITWSGNRITALDNDGFGVTILIEGRKVTADYTVRSELFRPSGAHGNDHQVFNY